MAAFWRILVAAAAAAVVGSAPSGPNLDEWKEGQEVKADEAAGAAAKQSKMAAVDRVVKLLSDLTTKILAEGEAEAKTYDKFACFCKDTTHEKTDAIGAGEDQQAGLTADLEELSVLRAEVDTEITTLLGEIKGAEAELKKAAEKRGAENVEYDKNAADLTAAQEAIDSAIAVLKASKPSLMQIQKVSKTVERATAMADALGLPSASRANRVIATMLQQDPSVPMQDYDFHSDGVVETLEKLKEDFGKKKTEIDDVEVSQKKEHDLLVQDKTHFITLKNAELDEANKHKATLQAQVGAASEQLSTVSAVLLDDKEYMGELGKMCHERALTWDQRTDLRAQELSAITSAVDIIKSGAAKATSAKTARLTQRKVDVRLAAVVASDDDSMEAIEEAAEEVDGYGEEQAGFLQLASVPTRLLQQKGAASAQVSYADKKAADKKPRNAQDAVVMFLRSQGEKIKSALMLKLASQVAADPFAKVKKLIQELIERLLSQAAAETSQKGWCDKSISDADQKKTYAAETIAEVNGEMATLEATRDTLLEEIEALGNGIEEIKYAQEDATEMREEEKAENTQTVDEAHDGLEAVEMAIDVLSKFYKTAAKATVEPSLAQTKRGPADDAPDAGFEAFEAYKGGQGEAKGIVGMLEVIKSDFKRTITSTTEAEEAAQADYAEFMTESGKSLAEKEVAHREKNGYLDDTKEKLSAASESLELQTSLLQQAIIELIQLQPPCVDTGMGYSERVAMREDEIEGLKKALCILQNYGEYADGTGDSC